MNKPTISIDFDGTICDHEFPNCGKLKKDVKEALTELSFYFEIVISSCRASAFFTKTEGTLYIDKMRKFLDKNGIPYDRIDMGDEGKVVAALYVDDKAISFTSWGEVLDQIFTDKIDDFEDTRTSDMEDK